jgi:hypothetical protein
MRVRPLTLVLACMLACSRTEGPSEKPPDEEPSFAAMQPCVGDPAPPLSLETLSGGRVTLPMSDADRAAILIFGSFS